MNHPSDELVRLRTLIIDELCRIERHAAATEYADLLQFAPLFRDDANHVALEDRFFKRYHAAATDGLVDVYVEYLAALEDVREELESRPPALLAPDTPEPDAGAVAFAPPT
ncbi:MAG: hypothetical protein ACOC4E_02080 [Patescibacteria group bacterium]